MVGSLRVNGFYKCMKFYGWEINIKGDILVQKIKVKSNFMFPTASFCFFFSNFQITHRLR